MNSQPQLLQIALDKKDVVYTPDWVARDMVEFFKPSRRILEPALGDGAIFKYIPDAYWCEIEKGRDFYALQERFDWIVSNPPYTQYSQWLYKSFDIAENIVYLVPCNKAFNGYEMMMATHKWGGIKHMRVYGTGAQLGFPIGFAMGAIYYKKGYHGGMEISYAGLAESREND
jgi:hypothetical protein